MQKYKKRHAPPFVRVERHMLFGSEEWKGLSAAEKLLYLYIKGKYNGSNNGKIRLTYKELKGVKGISAPKAISKAIKGLAEKGWVKIDFDGGDYRYNIYFELTWKYDTLR